MSKLNTIPRHVAVICDGNRRWARQKGWEVIKGHEYASEHVFENLADVAIELGIEYLTFWVFSTENWKRDKREVDFLLNLMRKYFKEDIQRLHAKGVRIETIGDISKFPEDIQDSIAEIKKQTAENTSITITLALNYGGRDELVRAMRAICQEHTKKEFDFTYDQISQHLDTRNLPDPDVIIRTGGEQRTSGFLLWQSEYAEYMFPKFYFPEFSAERFRQLMEEYALRQRRFGK